MKIIYQAEDGRPFYTEDECLEHEGDIPLRKFIGSRLGNAPFELDEVVTFFKKHFDELSTIVKPTGVKSCSFDDEWISNIGRDDCSHPESLDSKTKLEVKYRYCETATGYADDWDACWKATDGDPLDIIAYRIIE